jgi:hypothetical protein
MMKHAFVLATAFLAASQPASAQDFRPVIDRLAKAWERADVSVVGSHAASLGLSLDVEGRRTGPLPERQASSALRRLFDDRETIAITPGIAKELDGEPRRAFAELTWITRARGTTIPERSTIVFSLELEKGRWRVTEIRLIR